MRRSIATTVGAAALTAVLFAGACSSDSDSSSATRAKATTTSAGAPSDQAQRTAFCDDVKTAFGDYQPGFDAVFADGNDTPTLAEWAAFLPGPTQEFDDVIAKLKAVEPPAGDAEAGQAFQAAVDSLETVSKSFHDAQAAAAAGDQAEFDRLSDENQGTNVPAMQKATGTVGELCGFPQN